MISIVRTDSNNPDFLKLVSELDKELWATYGEAQAAYAPHNKIKTTLPTVLIYENDIPVGCGCFKNFDDKSVEIKRMFTDTSCRGKGLASRVLQELECWAKELGYESCKLETGKRMPDAVQFYEKHGYRVIPNYGQYAGVENSICFEKLL